MQHLLYPHCKQASMHPPPPQRIAILATPKANRGGCTVRSRAYVTPPGAQGGAAQASLCRAETLVRGYCVLGHTEHNSTYRYMFLILIVDTPPPPPPTHRPHPHLRRIDSCCAFNRRFVSCTVVGSTSDLFSRLLFFRLFCFSAASLLSFPRR